MDGDLRNALGDERDLLKAALIEACKYIVLVDDTDDPDYFYNLFMDCAKVQVESAR